MRAMLLVLCATSLRSTAATLGGPSSGWAGELSLETKFFVLREVGCCRGHTPPGGHTQGQRPRAGSLFGGKDCYGGPRTKEACKGASPYPGTPVRPHSSEAPGSPHLRAEAQDIYTPIPRVTDGAPPGTCLSTRRGRWLPWGAASSQSPSC